MAQTVAHARWKTTSDVQSAFPKAKVLNGERVHFEVAHNDLRLIAAFDFERQIAFVKFVGTHKEYDAVDPFEVSQFYMETNLDIRPIRSDTDHESAIREIDRLWGAPQGSPDGDKLDVLATLVDAYERSRWPIGPVSPRDMLTCAVTDMGRSQAELANLLGSRSLASDLLRGRRRISLNNARKIGGAWHIPIQLLVGEATDDGIAAA